LRDIMDGGAEKDAGGNFRHVQRIGDDRVDDHRECAERRDADDCEDGVAFQRLALGQYRRDRQRRRSAADGGRPACQDACLAALTGPPGGQQARSEGRHHDRQQSGKSQPAKRSHLRKGYLQAQQDDPCLKQPPRGEIQPVRSCIHIRHEAERQSDQQAEQDNREAILTSQPSRRERSCRAKDQTGEIVANGPALDGRRC